MYQTILFDLDGTLTDPGIGITNSVAYALKKYGITVNDRFELYKFIGPPLQRSFEMFYGFSPEDAVTAVEYYREYYQDKGIFENRLYDGIPKLLQSLKQIGKTLLVATSKPETFSLQILEYFDIKKYFTFVAGSNLDGSRSEKTEVITYALEAGHISDLSSSLMVGDRSYDIIGAKQAGIHSVGVLFGYGSREELETAGADHIAETEHDILSIIQQGEAL